MLIKALSIKVTFQSIWRWPAMSCDGSHRAGCSCVPGVWSCEGAVVHCWTSLRWHYEIGRYLQRLNRVLRVLFKTFHVFFLFSLRVWMYLYRRPLQQCWRQQLVNDWNSRFSSCHSPIMRQPEKLSTSWTRKSRWRMGTVLSAVISKAIHRWVSRGGQQVSRRDSRGLWSMSKRQLVLLLSTALQCLCHHGKQ